MLLAADRPDDEPQAQVCKLPYGAPHFPPATVASMTETAVEVGAVAPDFEAQDEHGNAWRLSEALTRAVQVLVFYRGDW